MADAFTQEIIRSKLLAVTSEMGTILARTSMSPIVYEVLDFACGITDATGAVIAQDNGLCLFTGTFSAWGMLTSKPRLDLSRTMVRALVENPAAIRSAIFAEMEAASELALIDRGFAAEHIDHTRSIDCRYHV